MDVTWIRVGLFTVLPVAAAFLYSAVDRTDSSSHKTAETLLAFLFGLGVAGSGIGGFFAHVFLSDLVAESIGWPTGSPFQLEIGFANLAVGTLGIIAAGRRDGFREAAVIAAAVFSFGASIVHLVDIIESGNLAPGNTVQNIANLVRPTLLIIVLTWSRQTAAESPEPDVFDPWLRRIGPVVGATTGVVASAFGVGYGVGSVRLVSLVGVVIALGITIIGARRQ